MLQSIHGMDNSALANTFEALPSGDLRRAALDALVHKLDPYDWRYLHTMLDARAFNFDIVGNLPVELVALIFAYLDTAQPYRLQRVSRQWQSALLSLPVLQSSLSVFHKSPAHVFAALTDQVSCTREARRIHAFRRLQPAAVIRLQFLDGNNYISNMRLSGHFVVWFQSSNGRNDRVVQALDLRSWKHHTLHTAGRETLQEIFISDTILVATTFSTTCYVWPLEDINDDKRKSFRIPNIQYASTVSCRGNIVACSAKTENLSSLSVFIWDFASHRGRSFRMQQDPSHPFFSTCGGMSVAHEFLLVPQPRTQSILLFGDVSCRHRLREDACDHEALGSIFFAKFDFEGICLRSSHMPSHDDKSMYLSRSRAIIPTGDDGKFLIDFQYLKWPASTRYTQHRGLFNEKAFEFSPIEWPENAQERRGSLPHFAMDDNTIFWKNTFCEFNTGDEGVYRLSQGSDDEHASAQIFKENAPLFEVHRHPDLFMNDRYLVRTLNNLLYVVSFDEDNQFPKISGPFHEANAHVEVLIPEIIQE